MAKKLKRVWSSAGFDLEREGIHQESLYSKELGIQWVETEFVCVCVRERENVKTVGSGLARGGVSCAFIFAVILVRNEDMQCLHVFNVHERNPTYTSFLTSFFKAIQLAVSVRPLSLSDPMHSSLRSIDKIKNFIYARARAQLQWKTLYDINYDI